MIYYVKKENSMYFWPVATFEGGITARHSKVVVQILIVHFFYSIFCMCCKPILRIFERWLVESVSADDNNSLQIMFALLPSLLWNHSASLLPPNVWPSWYSSSLNTDKGGSCEIRRMWRKELTDNAYHFSSLQYPFMATKAWLIVMFRRLRELG